jgi:hypothetical protein
VQCSFLLGILPESHEPDAPEDFGKEDWEKAEDLLNEAFQTYLPLYSISERSRITDEGVA